jgi:hypothetical protein
MSYRTAINKPLSPTNIDSTIISREDSGEIPGFSRPSLPLSDNQVTELINETNAALDALLAPFQEDYYDIDDTNFNIIHLRRIADLHSLLLSNLSISPIPPSSFLVVTPSSWQVPTSTNPMSMAVSITSNVSWTITSDEPTTWLTKSLTSGNDNAVLTLTAAPNLSSASRQATVVVSSLTTPAIVRTITVTQQGVDTPVPYINIDPSSWNTHRGIATAFISIDSNVEWSVSDFPSWLTVNPTSMNGSGFVSLTTSENSTLSSRTATITVSGSGISKTIIITQEGTEPSDPYQLGNVAVFLNSNNDNLGRSGIWGGIRPAGTFVRDILNRQIEEGFNVRDGKSTLDDLMFYGQADSINIEAFKTDPLNQNDRNQRPIYNARFAMSGGAEMFLHGTPRVHISGGKQGNTDDIPCYCNQCNDNDGGDGSGENIHCNKIWGPELLMHDMCSLQMSQGWCRTCYGNMSNWHSECVGRTEAIWDDDGNSHIVSWMEHQNCYQGYEGQVGRLEENSIVNPNCPECRGTGRERGRGPNVRFHGECDFVMLRGETERGPKVLLQNDIYFQGTGGQFIIGGGETVINGGGYWRNGGAFHQNGGNFYMNGGDFFVNSGARVIFNEGFRSAFDGGELYMNQGNNDGGGQIHCNGGKLIMNSNPSSWDGDNGKIPAELIMNSGKIHMNGARRCVDCGCPGIRPPYCLYCGSNDIDSMFIGEPNSSAEGRNGRMYCLDCWSLNIRPASCYKCDSTNIQHWGEFMLNSGKLHMNGGTAIFASSSEFHVGNKAFVSINGNTKFFLCDETEISIGGDTKLDIRDSGIRNTLEGQTYVSGNHFETVVQVWNGKHESGKMNGEDWGGWETRYLTFSEFRRNQLSKRVFIDDLNVVIDLGQNSSSVDVTPITPKASASSGDNPEQAFVKESSSGWSSDIGKFLSSFELANPSLFSNNDRGFEVSASSVSFNNQPYFAFNQGSNNGWVSDQNSTINPVYLQIKLDRRKIINDLRITPMNRAILSFRLMGSFDGVNFSLIEVFSRTNTLNQTFHSVSPYNTPYLFYRIEILNVAVGTTNIGIQNLIMIERVPDDMTGIGNEYIQIQLEEALEVRRIQFLSPMIRKFKVWGANVNKFPEEFTLIDEIEFNTPNTELIDLFPYSADLFRFYRIQVLRVFDSTSVSMQNISLYESIPNMTNCPHRSSGIPVWFEKIGVINGELNITITGRDRHDQTLVFSNIDAVLNVLIAPNEDNSLSFSHIIFDNCRKPVSVETTEQTSFIKYLAINRCDSVSLNCSFHPQGIIDIGNSIDEIYYLDYEETEIFVVDIIENINNPPDMIAVPTIIKGRRWVLVEEMFDSSEHNRVSVNEANSNLVFNSNNNELSINSSQIETVNNRGQLWINGGSVVSVTGQGIVFDNGDMIHDTYVRN